MSKVHVIKGSKVQQIHKEERTFYQNQEIHEENESMFSLWKNTRSLKERPLILGKEEMH